MKKNRTALVLGGGGARGLAHLGVLQVLEENRLLPDFVVGTSMGAIVGGAYCLYRNSEEMSGRVEECLTEDTLRDIEKRFTELTKKERADSLWGRFSKVYDEMHRLYLWNKSAMDQSLVDNAVIAGLINKLVGSASYKDLGLPFYAVAYDLKSLSDIVLGQGSLATALHASSAVPGVFEPVRRDGYVLVDGCVDQEIPAEIAYGLGADSIIAVDVGGDLTDEVGVSAAEVMARVSTARVRSLRRRSLQLADLVVRPDVGSFHWSEFSRSHEAVNRGRRSAEENLEQISKALHPWRGRTWWTRWFKPSPPEITVQGVD